MLHQTAPFPFPGSSAKFGDADVTIHQLNGDGTVSINTGGHFRRVGRDELTEATLIRRWLDERVQTDFPAARIPATDLAEDFRAWARAHDAEQPTDREFTAMMFAEGHKVVRGNWRAPGDIHARTRVLFRLALKAPQA